MNSRIIIIVIFLILLVSGIGSLWYFKPGSKQKQAYILNEKVFEEFDGTKELRIKVTKLQEKQRGVLDSILLTIKSLETASIKGSQEKLLSNKQLYNNLLAEFTSTNQKHMQEFSEEIWKQINQYLSEYGKKEGYDFIYGANGTGTIMFANSGLDISNEVIIYINKKYAGK